MPDPHAILAEVLGSYSDPPKWTDAPFEQIRRVSNTSVGNVGQDFIERLCEELGCPAEPYVNARGKRSRRGDWDLRINSVRFELKTATEDVRGAFQFDHIRHHKSFDAVLGLGIAPAAIYFGAWTKAAIATEAAGNLVTMDSGSSATWKLTKKPGDLRPISEFHPLRLVNDST